MKKTESTIMYGKPAAEEVYSQIMKQSQAIKSTPKLGIVFIGDNAASKIYIKQKIAACEKLGFKFELIQRESNLSTTDVVQLISKLNNDNSVTGIIVQMPLPEHIDKTEVLRAIDPKKDVDGLTPENLGNTFLGVDFERFTPCTALGVIKLLEYYNVKFAGKKICVVGSGNIAGKPIATMLSNRKATVTLCNSQTTDLKSICLDSDIVICAVGKARLIKADMVKKGAAVIDIGISREDEKAVGDVDFEKVLAKAAFVSPFPGGVGQMTVACLMWNLMKTAK